MVPRIEKTLAAIAVSLFFCGMPVSSREQPAELSGYVFDVAPNVPAKETKLVFDAMVKSQSYFEKFGIRLNSTQRGLFVTKLVNTGHGNTERGGGGSCCTSQSAVNPKGPRLFFDVGHRHWNRNSPRKRRTVAHEYTHGIQSIAGVKLWSRSLMADWMEEGMAEYYAAEIMDGRGKGSTNKAASNALSWAVDNGAIRYSLKQLEPNGGHPHPGGMGHLAVIGLVDGAPKGSAAPVLYMFSIRTLGRDEAFKRAFGISRARFYQEFERWRIAYIQGKTRKSRWHRL